MEQSVENFDVIVPSVGYKKFPNNTFLLTIDDALGENGYRRYWSLFKDSEDIYKTEDNVDIGFLKGSIIEDKYDNPYDVISKYVIVDDLFSEIEGYDMLLFYRLSVIAIEKRWDYITTYDKHNTLYDDDFVVSLGFESKIDGEWVPSSSLVGVNLSKYHRIYHRIPTYKLKSKAQKLYDKNG